MFGAGGDAAAGSGGSVVLLVLLAAAVGARGDRYADADYTGVKVPDYEYEAAGKESDARDQYHESLDYRRTEERRVAAPKRTEAPREPEEDPWPAETTPSPPPRRHSRRPRSRSDDEPRRRRDYPRAPDDAPDYTYPEDTDEIPKFKHKRRSKERRDISEELTRALVGERSGRGRRGGETDDLELPPDEGRFPHGLDEPLLSAPLPSRPPSVQDKAPSDKATPANREPGRDSGDDYGSYDDMKPVFKLKDKLPSLLRRSTPSRELAPTRARALSRGPARGGARRAGAGRTSRAHSRVTVYEPPAPTTTAATTTTTTTTTTTKPTPPVAVTSNNMSELLEPHRKLSLAEKSRLSILKKSMMKDSGKEGEASKPAVLLRVTEAGGQTVVMMEPRGTLPPFSEQNRRYLQELDETPQRLKQVKRLMRQKLLGRAKSISDLTENWDELVCDYIDTSGFVSRADLAPMAAPTAFALAVASPWLFRTL